MLLLLLLFVIKMHNKHSIITLSENQQNQNASTFRKVIPEHMLVEFHNGHNHPLNIPATLAHMPMSDETRQELLELFALGYRPSQALAMRKEKLMERADPEQVHLLLADKSLIPDIYQCNRYFYKIFSSHY